MGVNIFFVLSGFLITRILLNEKDTSPSFKRFYSKRVLRIFPIYYFVLIVLTLMGPSVDKGWCAIYLQNYYYAFDFSQSPLRHTWSLAVEEHFYFLWPFLVYTLPRARSKWVCMAVIPVLAIVAGALTVWFFDPLHADALLLRGTHFRALSLSLGATLAYFEKDIRDTHRMRWLAGMIAILVMSAVILVLPRFIKELVPIWKFLFHICSAFVSLAIVTIPLIFSNRKIDFFRPLEWRPVRYIGTISYGLYMYHAIIYQWIGITLGPPISIWFARAVVGLVIAVASTSYYLLERPLINMRRYLK